MPLDVPETAATPLAKSIAVELPNGISTPALFVTPGAVAGDGEGFAPEKVSSFVPEKLDSCNSIVSFPEYHCSLNLGAGRLETPFLEVAGDFTFQCGMGMLHGYVKAVDDPATADLEAVKREVTAFKPVSGAGCCG